ncbi:MAG TPA: hypothetical protein VMK65_01060, partial [Longimicrobiales bacterium]|nr:hypothetical protein [Longimicrobiales bacterium]
MDNPFHRWLRPSPPPRPRESEALEPRLRQLEQEAGSALPGQRGMAFNRAGDLCQRTNDPARALAYYGNAIDTYLADDQPEPARGVAQKIIRLHPKAVRTLCTLTWLDLASGLAGDARVHLDLYVDGAKRAGREPLAREQILAMARSSADPEFRQAAAAALLRLLHPEGAKEVERMV